MQHKCNLTRSPVFWAYLLAIWKISCPDQVAIAGYFCDNLDQPVAGQRYLARQLRYASRPDNAPANAIDLGDVNVFPLEPEKHFSAVISQCEAVLKTGARMVLVGGDSSGLKALGIAVRNITGEDVPVVSIIGDITVNLSKTQPVILSVDLQELAGIWTVATRSPDWAVARTNDCAN